jgi:hypothetical protein
MTTPLGVCDKEAAASPRFIRQRVNNGQAKFGGFVMHGVHVVGWIELGVLCEACAVAAEECAPATPAAATNDVTGMLDDEVSAVADKLAIHAEDGCKRRLHLRGRIERCLQRPHGKRNENLQSLDVILSRKTY